MPDQLNHAPSWTAKCAAAQKDWRKLDLVFPDSGRLPLHSRCGVRLQADRVGKDRPPSVVQPSSRLYDEHRHLDHRWDGAVGAAARRASQPPTTTTAPCGGTAASDDDATSEPSATRRRAAADNTDEGIPVTDPDVRRACGGCHVAERQEP